MPYITREDGEKFVIPSYRDTLRVKSTGILKREILLLSSNYGEYITLQKKAADHYEAAFSTDTGYLLGESIWNYFKRPYDMIYCEVIPNTSEAILVIVKSGTVYLDGSFPVDSIPEELVIFKTQTTNFHIYLYGDVPISEDPEENKFSFDRGAVKEFTILSEPIFNTLPLYKNYHLELVDIALRAQGIGVLPVKQLLGVFVVLGLVWMVWEYISTHKKELPIMVVGPANPYQSYYDALSKPDPVKQLDQIDTDITLLNQIPGWSPRTMHYEDGKLKVAVVSNHTTTAILYQWAALHHATVDLTAEGFTVTMVIIGENRPAPTTILDVDRVIATIIDRISVVMPGNHVTLVAVAPKKGFSDAEIEINLAYAPPITLGLIASQLKGLPLVLSSAVLNVTPVGQKGAGGVTGKINLHAIGN